MTDESPIDEGRFRDLRREVPKAEKPAKMSRDVPLGAWAMRVVDVPWEPRTQAAVVWCYFASGRPIKYTGSLTGIIEKITASGRPCFAHVCTGAFRNDGLWDFHNVCSASGRAVLRVIRVCKPGFPRAGNNDHFIIQHYRDGEVVEQKRYRKLPRAFPRDFLHVVGVTSY